MSHVSGLAAAVRGATESDTFDLAGHNTTTIQTNITNAFDKPLPIKEMIRITFVTGAGKLGRQKYDDNAAKTVTSTLRELNFEEDRGASCIPECAGTFKLQHDTGKNLKTVVVFPRITDDSSNNGGEGGAEGGTTGSDSNTSGFLTKGSVEEMIALSSNKVFESMVKSQCPSWTQKKGCTTAISSIKQQLEILDEKLLTGTPLTDGEQTFYDAVSSTSLEEKLDLVKDMMHKQVDDGLITAKEKTQLLHQVTERLDKVTKEISDAETQGQKKKLEKLQGVKEKVTTRKNKLSNITPLSKPHSLKHEKEITALRVELLPLQDLQEGGKGKLLTLKETQMLSRKEEILDEISELQYKSRGWFETDDDFDARIEASEATFRVQNKGNKMKKKSTSSAPKGGGGGGGGGGNAWSTTASSKSRPKTTTMKKTTTTQQRKPTTRGGGVFAAMMGDSDSD